MSALKIVQIGLGPLGIKMIQFAKQRTSAFEVVGGVDIHRATADRVGNALNTSQTWTSIADAMKSSAGGCRHFDNRLRSRANCAAG